MKKFLFAAFLVVGLAAVLAPPQAFAQEDKPFTVHGEVRFRGEYDNNASDFDKNTDDGGLFWPYRVRIAVEGHFTKNVVGYIEVQSLGTAGGDVSAFSFLDPMYSPRWAGNGIAQDTGLYQGYVTLNELWSKSFSLRFGRQEIVLGNEFIFGDEDFYGGIVHDGIMGTWNLKKATVNAWYTRPFEGTANSLTANLPPGFQNLSADPTTVEEFGGYVTFNVHKNWGVDVYALNLNNRGNGARFQTFGARFDHMNWDTKGLVWNIEYAMQAGNVSSAAVTGNPNDVKASGSAGEALIGWNFKGGKNVHRVYAKVEFASGNKTPSSGFDDKYEGFVPLYGEIHGRAGNGDWFQVAGASTALGGNSLVGGVSGEDPGLMAIAVGYTGMYKEKHELGVDFWNYASDQKVPIFDSSNPNATSDKLGTAFDVWYGYNYSKNVAFQVSYSNLSPGDALTGKGDLGGTSIPTDNVERLYGQVRLRF